MNLPSHNRRWFLKAAGGLAVALPLLPSLRARAQTAFPKRIITMYTPNGQIHDAWWPTGGETDFVLNQIHQPLLPYRDRLVLLKGVDLKSAAGGPGGPHQRGIGTLFTGQQLLAGEFVDGCGSRAGWAGGISIDQEVANHIGVDTPFKSLELGVRASENDVQGRISYSGPGEPLPPILQPLEVYDRLFRNLVPPPPDGGMPEIDPLVLQRRSVLDSVDSQLAYLSRKVSSEDKHKLDSHLDLVRDIERRLGGMTIQCAKPDAPPTLDPVSELDMPRIGELQVDLLALAFACDLTRVASFEISTGLNRIRYPWINYTKPNGTTAQSLGEGHPLSHMGSTDADARAQLVGRAQWHSSLIARLFDKLALIPEGDGTTALDNTLLVWCSEVSEGNVHSHTNMPFLIGGGGWHFRTGRYLDCGGASHGNLLVSLLNAMGVQTNSFGLPQYSTGPLTPLTA